MYLSIIIPLYNEQESLAELLHQLQQIITANSYQAEIIFVDDGSTDNSFAELKNLANQSTLDIKIIRFRRNFGKSSALAAGFNLAQGEIIITMDADLQDDPAEIPNLISKINEGYDLVSGWKHQRKDPFIKTYSSKLFNKTVSCFSGIKIHDFNCGLKAYNQEVIKNIAVYGELHRFLPVLAYDQGFKITEIKVNHRSRLLGKSKFGINRFVNGFVDLLTVLILTKYTKKPGHFFGKWGIFSFVLGFIFCSYLSFLWLIGDRPIGNRPLLFLGILLLIIGIQLISMGLLGELIIQTNKTQDYNIKEIYTKKN